jgi:PhnB protein
MPFGQYLPPGAEGGDRIMHGVLAAPNGFVLMGADTPPGTPVGEHAGYTISLSGDDEETLHGYWDRLSEGGEIEVPLEKQMWGDTFGQCRDRFGISWLVNITGQGDR